MRPTNLAKKTCPLALSLLLLAGCNGSGSSTSTTTTNDTSNTTSTTTTTMSVTPSLGLVRFADVRVLDLDGVPISGASGTLGSDGTVSLTLPADLNQPLIIEVSGTATAEYFDEASAAFVPFTVGSTLRAVIPEPRSSVGVTPLTEIATARALASGATTAAEITTVNNGVRDEFLPGIADIAAVPTLIGDAAAKVGATDVADLYALYLATLAKLAAGSSGDIVKLTQQFAEDFADGKFDGAVDGVALSDALVDILDSGYADLLKNARMAALGFASTSLSLDDLISKFTGGTGGGSTGGDMTRYCQSGESTGSATLPSVVESKVINFKVDSIVTGATVDFALNDVLAFTFSSSGSLFINDELFSTDPYLCDGNEISWYNSTANKLYALSFVGTATDEVNEFNLISGDPLAFAAQLLPTTDETTGVANLELVTALAGTYTVTGTTSGTHSRGNVTIYDDGQINFDLGVIYPASMIQRVDDRTSIADEPRIQVSYGADDDGPVINIYLDPSDHSVIKTIQYRYRTESIDVQANFGTDTATDLVISGSIVNDASLSGQWELFLDTVLANDGGLSAGAVTFSYDGLVLDGKTYEVRPSNRACTVANGEGVVNGSSITNVVITCVDSTTLDSGMFGTSFEADSILRSNTSTSAVQTIPITGLGDDRFLELGNVGATFGNAARLRMIPINQTGTFTCGNGPSSYRLVEAMVYLGGVQYVADSTKGSCTINVTATGSTYEGTFSGSFVSAGGTTTVVTNGLFRNDGSSL